MKFIKEVFKHFFHSDTFHKGASLAYYAVFSFIPTLIIIISVFGLMYGEEAVNGELFTKLKGAFGEEGALQIEDIIKNHHINYNSWLTAGIGFGGLILNASVLIGAIRDCLNSIWDIKEKPQKGLIKYIRKHLSASLILIGLFFIIFASTLISSFISKHAHNFHEDYQYSYFYEHFASFMLMSILFTFMYGILGDAKIHWKVILSGGFITSLLFIFGKTAIGMYIGNGHVASTFGNASLLALLMLWVYYTSQIIFLGASYIAIVSEKIGHDIVPKHNALKIEVVELKK